MVSTYRLSVLKFPYPVSYAARSCQPELRSPAVASADGRLGPTNGEVRFPDMERSRIAEQISGRHTSSAAAGRQKQVWVALINLR